VLNILRTVVLYSRVTTIILTFGCKLVSFYWPYSTCWVEKAAR